MLELPADETWTDEERLAHQWKRLRAMLPEVAATNRFYGRKLMAAGLTDALATLGPRTWSRLPFTTKGELSADQVEHPPFGSNLTYPPARYSRLHETSGTTGRPLRILDTPESWHWWSDIWRRVYHAAGVAREDRIFFCFSFGPFIGFWSAFAAAEAIGALAISGGAQSSMQRVAAIVATEATVLLCTPTYALRLDGAAREGGVDLAASKLRVSIHAGEPGASIPATRDRIEAAFGVRAFDHTGATEVGPTGFSCTARDGVHVVESEFLAEIIDPVSGEASDDGDGELVLTSLGRWGSPAIRYRTGDRVSATRGPCPCGRTLLKLVGGILGRVDDMITVRGVNVFPSAIEGIVRRFTEVEEFRVELFQDRGMDALRCVIEPRAGTPASVAERVAGRVREAIRGGIGISCDVIVAEPASLPRFELKANRFARRDSEG
ncbi:phenylacetate--CoA ligase [soil metagenome]